MATSVKTKSLVNAVYEALWETIVTSEEQILGTAITEVGVAAQFGIARPTAKAVVERLIADGVLVRDGRRGARVPQLAPSDVRDIYWNRSLLEVAANAALAARRKVPVEAVIANRDLRTHAAVDLSARVVASDIAFHRALVAGHGSSRLSRLHSFVMSEAHLCMGQVRGHRLLAADVSAGEHDAIMQAIREGDAEATSRLTIEHLTRGSESLIQGLFPATVPEDAAPEVP